MIESSSWPAQRAALAPPWQPLHWMGVTSLAYAGLYGLANQLTSLRADVGEGVFGWERAIPFVGWSIVPYLSITVFFVLSFFVDADRQRLRRHVARLFVVLLVSVLCYAAFPLRFTFERPPTQGLVGLMFDLLGACDMPYNRAPSLHIGVLTVLWVRFAPGACDQLRDISHGTPSASKPPGGMVAEAGKSRRAPRVQGRCVPARPAGARARR
jgi:hypothetical protein